MKQTIYRKKTRNVEAMQWTGDNLGDLLNWAPGFISYASPLVWDDQGFPGRKPCSLELKLARSIQLVHISDWIIKHDTDKYYVCDNIVFKDLYDKTEDSVEKYTEDDMANCFWAARKSGVPEGTYHYNRASEYLKELKEEEDLSNSVEVVLKKMKDLEEGNK